MRILSILFLFLSAIPAFANDSAVGIAATGLYFKQEKNISIEKEVLFISEDKIEVTYHFKNHASTDIVTEIAFPMPDYKYDPSGSKPYPRYDDFTVELNNVPMKYREEIRAFVKGVDQTNLLNELGVSIKDFSKKDKAFFNKLSKQQKQLLIDNGVVVPPKNEEKGYAFPLWSVSRKYYWPQTFPANRTITIKHSYTPYEGFDYRWDIIKQNSCAEKEKLNRLRKDGPFIHYRYIYYILTTANNWKQPIKTFHIVVDSDDSKIDVALCLAPLKKTGPTKYEATLTDFIPTKDITVFFF